MPQRDTPRAGAISGLRSEAVRQSNLTAILRSLHLSGPASRSDLVRHTGLTRSAVGALIGELVERGYLTEERAASDGSPGRPSPVALLDSRHHGVVAVEVLVDSIAAAIVGLGGEIISSVRVDRTRTQETAEETVREVAPLVKQLVSQRAEETHIYGMGVTVAGVVRRGNNTVMMAPNLGWHNVPLGRLLTQATGLDVPISVANDGDLGALAESRRGVAVGHDDIIYVSGEVGVGGGVISGGVAVTGTAGYAGEIGHLPVNPDGQDCMCGSVGCWETEVGEEALLRRTGRRHDGGRAEMAKLLTAANSQDPVVIDGLGEHAKWLSIGIAGLINIFDPTIVVLGGYLGDVYPVIEDRVQAELERRTMGEFRSTVKVAASALGGDTALIGAAELAWDPVLADPAGAVLRRVTVESG